MAKKAGLDIFYKKKKNARYTLPNDCKFEDLKIVIDKISDDELYTAFDSNRIDTNKLYELFMRILTNNYDTIDMNAQGRKEIAKYISTLEDIKDKLESMMDDEQDKFDNMPEGLQESERGEAMQEAIEQLETACENLDEVINCLQEI